jgi:hypothetical protein
MSNLSLNLASIVAEGSDGFESPISNIEFLWIASLARNLRTEEVFIRATNPRDTKRREDLYECDVRVVHGESLREPKW